MANVKGEKKPKKNKDAKKRKLEKAESEQPATAKDETATETQQPEVKVEKKKPKKNKDVKKTKGKKRKLDKAESEQPATGEDKTATVTGTQQPEVKAENKGRPYTVSIALPGSILDNAQSPDLRSYLVGQIARAAVIFNVDEIVVFDESCSSTDQEEQTGGDFTGVGHSKTTLVPGADDTSRCNVQLGRILQYLECPQYLRKSLFPKHHDLKYAGLINPLDSPHHMRAEHKCKYREGVVLDRPIREKKGSFVDCGIYKPVQIDRKVTPKIRVTVEMLDDHQIGGDDSVKFYKGRAVPDDQPRVNDGIYWGYKVRLATSLSAALTECPYTDTGKYDVIMGTSERGDLIDDFQFPVGVETPVSNFKHLLVVFGGVNGLELSLSNDELLSDISDPRYLFDCYLNTCPDQGSRTIRTEEAIFITLSALRPKMKKVSSTV